MIALAAVRATREGMVRGEGGDAAVDHRHRRCRANAPAAEPFDGTTEIAVFPGDLPADAGSMFEPGAEPFRGLRRLRQETDFASCASARRSWRRSTTALPALPHIRLDRALQFLIGDRLR